MKKVLKIILLIIIICVASYFIVGYIKNKDNKYKRPNYDYIATIYHSVMKGIDDGTEYFYYIYESKNENNYFYIKSEIPISIQGTGKEKDVYSGSINNKEDLKKITSDIEKDSDREAESSVEYTYLNEGSNVECVDIDELGNKIFNQQQDDNNGF